jgi:hypothetical protein
MCTTHIHTHTHIHKHLPFEGYKHIRLQFGNGLVLLALAVLGLTLGEELELANGGIAGS